MDVFARMVYGYHGCRKEVAHQLLNGELPLERWKPSENPYDRLGHGIYFWEYGPDRAQKWATKRWGAKAEVIGAVVQLGRCLDLTDIWTAEWLNASYDSLRGLYESRGEPLPTNNKGRNELDCLVINHTISVVRDVGMDIQTVRGPFLEGRKAFEGSTLFAESHVQLVVRDVRCIVGVFRPTQRGQS